MQCMSSATMETRTGCLDIDSSPDFSLTLWPELSHVL